MDISKDLDSNLDEFNKLCLNLVNCQEKFTNEHFAVILLNSLPDSYMEVRNAIKYGSDELSYNTVVNAFKLRELKLTKETKNEGLFAREEVRIETGITMARKPNIKANLGLS